MAADDYMIQLKITAALIQLEHTIEFLHENFNESSSRNAQMMLAFLRNMLSSYSECANAMCEKFGE